MKACIYPTSRLQRSNPEFWKKVSRLKIKEPKKKDGPPSFLPWATEQSPKPNSATSTTQPETSIGPNPPLVPVGQMTMHYASLPKDEKRKRLEEAHDAWDLFWFVHNVPFHLIGTIEFKNAIKKTKQCPVYQPVGREMLAGVHLDKQSALSDEAKFNARHLRLNVKYKFILTGDGCRSKTKWQYHNFMLVTPVGPVFLGIKDVTGEGGTGEDVFSEFVAVQEVFPT